MPVIIDSRPVSEHADETPGYRGRRSRSTSPESTFSLIPPPSQSPPRIDVAMTPGYPRATIPVSRSRSSSPSPPVLRRISPDEWVFQHDRSPYVYDRYGPHERRYAERSSASLAEQVSALGKHEHKVEWLNLHGLIEAATAQLRVSQNTDSNPPTCTSISLLSSGSSHIVYELVFSDKSKIAARVSRLSSETYRAELMQSEVATMKFVRDSGLYADVPVPKVHASDFTFTNPACAPYVLMDVVKGVSLARITDKQQQLSEFDSLTIKQQRSVVKALAMLQASLSRPVSFDKIGSIVPSSRRNGGGDPSVGSFVSRSKDTLGGPFTSIEGFWNDRLERAMDHALEKWCDPGTNEPDFTPTGAHPTPQTFTELFQLLSSLIPHFTIPKSYSTLVLHHPNISLKTVLFDRNSLTTDNPKITGILGWHDVHILPLMLAATFPADLRSSSQIPFVRPGHNPSEDWTTVPHDWSYAGEPSDIPEPEPEPQVRDKYGSPVVIVPPPFSSDYSRQRERPDPAKRVRVQVRRYYLRAYFGACFASALRIVYASSLAKTNQSENDKTKHNLLAYATLFMDATYYLKFHEVIIGGWPKWLAHADWIRETYRRLRVASDRGEFEEGKVLVGPNVYRGQVEEFVFDLGKYGSESTSSAGEIVEVNGAGSGAVTNAK
ncbi:hypothetical protein K474DRAFT_1663067 [Panus rudis PR-1116 ss-1]|nr:hypothetical protein K474DRAFT_1663067 [Panus rudis PR-1116 ss-1]